jgi:hypothetical protein
MFSVRSLLCATLLVSAAIGTLIVVSDGYLWSTAPTHALGLIVFIVVDVALAIALTRRIWFASLLSMGIATIQELAMLGDVLTYSTPDTPQQAFRTYLLNDPAFVALLVVQLVLLGIAFGATNLQHDYYMIRRWVSQTFNNR